MKIEYSEGCTTTGVYIDDKPFVNLSIEEQKEVLLKVLKHLKNPSYSIQEFLISAATEEGEFEDLGKCEQCGDYVYNYTIEL